MPEDRLEGPGETTPTDIGAYCRDVEAHLTRVNGGHLVRVVGPGFELVRGWAADGIPLSVVHRGIEQKAARHQLGASRRPLRIEFCDEDVRALFADWRRAVGIPVDGPAPNSEQPQTATEDSATEERRVTAQALDRAIERLSRGAGRLDWPEQLREVVSGRLVTLTGIRSELKGKRGEARTALLARVAESESTFSEELRSAAPSALLEAVQTSAEGELASYRGRLAPEAWSKAVETTADRLLRERLGLPLP